jgi:hypothetical protein
MQAPEITEPSRRIVQDQTALQISPNNGWEILDDYQNFPAHLLPRRLRSGGNRPPEPTPEKSSTYTVLRLISLTGNVVFNDLAGKHNFRPGLW